MFKIEMLSISEIFTVGIKRSGFDTDMQCEIELGHLSGFSLLPNIFGDSLIKDLNFIGRDVTEVLVQNLSYRN